MAQELQETAHPLVRRLVLDAPPRACVRVRYRTDGEPSLEQRDCAEGGRREIVLARLVADRTYTFAARVGDDEVATGAFRTAPLPQALDGIRWETTGRGSAGLTVLSLRGGVYPSIVVLDDRARVVWYRGVEGIVGPVTRRARGTFVYLDRTVESGGARTLHEVTLDGREMRSFSGLPGFSFLHHDVIETPEETLLFLTLDSERTVSDTTWVGDRIIEWSPEEGWLRERWDIFDDYDPVADRGRGSVPGDFAHANSISMGDDGSAVVSLSFLSQVVGLAPGLASVVWRLGGPGSDFRFGPGAEFSSSHAVTEPAPGRLLLFDNALGRPPGRRYSRGLELTLDRDSGTADVAWQFRADRDLWSRNLSSTRRLRNGNTLVLFGSGSLSPQELFEVEPDGDVVWHVTIRGVGSVYRATPLATLAGEVTAGG